MWKSRIDTIKHFIKYEKDFIESTNRLKDIEKSKEKIEDLTEEMNLYIAYEDYFSNNKEPHYRSPNKSYDKDVEENPDLSFVKIDKFSGCGYTVYYVKDKQGNPIEQFKGYSAMNREFFTVEMDYSEVTKKDKPKNKVRRKKNGK